MSESGTHLHSVTMTEEAFRATPQMLADYAALRLDHERLQRLADDRENLAIANARLWDELRLAEGRHHPGYLIGVHWMTAAYGRICGGEDEAAVMADYGYAKAIPVCACHEIGSRCCPVHQGATDTSAVVTHD